MIIRYAKRGLIALLAVLLLTLTASAQLTENDVKTFTLKNGMKFLVLEDHSIPNANMYLFFKVGSRNEYPGITGLSHFFEHMMFNGAKIYGPKEFDRVMEAAGGNNNAYTTENVTVYTDFFPADSMETIFKLEADRIGNLALDDKMVESERGVIISERITGLENSNFRLLEEQVKAVAFIAHPYRWSVIGHESDIKNWSKSDLQRYFDVYYAPNNALVVMSGAINTAEVKKMAEKYFEPIPANQPPRPVHTKEPKQMGEKRLTVHKDVSSQHLLMVHHVPESKHNDYYAIQMLDSILTGGKSSRLYKALVDRDQTALQIFSYTPLSMDPHLFYIFAVCANGVDATKVEQTIIKELDLIAKEGVTPKELQKIKNRKLVDFYDNMSTINDKADNVGTYEVFFGSYTKLFNAPAEFEKVTVEDIKRVAATYFTKTNRTVGILKKGDQQ